MKTLYSYSKDVQTLEISTKGSRQGMFLLIIPFEMTTLMNSYELPGGKNANDQWKLHPGFDSDISPTVIRDATLSTPLVPA